MFAIIGIVVYLILGYFWVRFFTTWILDDKKWGDRDDFGPVSAIIVHVMWLPMAAIILMFVAVWAVLQVFSPASIRQFYNLNPKE